MKSKSLRNLVVTLTIVIIAFMFVIIAFCGNMLSSMNAATDLVETVDESFGEAPDNVIDEEFFVESTPDTNAPNNNGNNSDVKPPVDNSDTDVVPPADNTDTDVIPPADNTDTDEFDKIPDGDDNIQNPGEDNTQQPDGDVDNIPDNGDDTIESEPLGKGFVIVEDYKNSMADGSGSMLWNLNVSYNGLNASDLLAQHGLYIVFKVNYSDDAENASKWYSFAHASYYEETETHNSTGYLNGYIHSIQFAIVDVAPDDLEMGGYHTVELADSNFKVISNVFYNAHFIPSTFSIR